MTFTFRPAVREDVSIIIGLAGSTGSGKTYTGMRLATGMAGEKPFCVIDTEAGRAKHYADLFKFDHGDLAPPFTPERYAEAIKAADDAGYPVIMVDSFSHEWAGDGGCLDMQEEEFKRLGYNDKVKLLSWSKPKGEHKKMVSRLLQTRAHLIICLRAEEKIDMVKNKETGKMEVVPKTGPAGFKGWIPICEKNLPFEFTVSLLLLADTPGYPHSIKLQEQHKAFFPLERAITEESGKKIAAWASGSKPAPAMNTISENDARDLEKMCQDNNIPLDNLLHAAGVARIKDIPATAHTRAIKWVDAAIAKRTTG